MQNQLSLSLLPVISYIESADNLELHWSQQTLRLQPESPGLRDALKLLCRGGASELHLSQLIIDRDGSSSLPQFYYYLEQFAKQGLICYSIADDDYILATIVPNAPQHQLQFQTAALNTAYQLSRFAYCHREADRLVLESPLSYAKIILASWQSSALLTELTQPIDAQTLSQRIPSISETTAQLFLSFLLTAGMMDATETSETNPVFNSASPFNPAVSQWEFHDLLFHSRVRTGRHNHRVGRTYRLSQQFAPLPVVKPKMSDCCIPLYQPNLEQLAQTDISLTQALETRASNRSFGSEPITAQQLGEFLYRSARVRSVTQIGAETISSRPYPSAGACYELEVYLIVNRCQDIAAGFYHYDPQDHQLYKLPQHSSVTALLLEAKQRNSQRHEPQVLIILAARFQRVNWHYESIAYAGILKNVGILFQTMYLVATALELAACALGSGNSDWFAQAAGTEVYAETSVGEFMLGSLEHVEGKEMRR